jgi:hypothetical protein
MLPFFSPNLAYFLPWDAPHKGRWKIQWVWAEKCQFLPCSINCVNQFGCVRVVCVGGVLICFLLTLLISHLEAVSNIHGTQFNSILRINLARSLCVMRKVRSGATCCICHKVVLLTFFHSIAGPLRNERAFMKKVCDLFFSHTQKDFQHNFVHFPSIFNIQSSKHQAKNAHDPFTLSVITAMKLLW